MLRKALAVTAALAATGVAVSAAAGDHDGPRPLRPTSRGRRCSTRRSASKASRVTGAATSMPPDGAERAVPGVPRERDTNSVVGNLPAPCNPAGLAFGPDGRLYIADSGRIMVLRPDAGTPPTAEVYATDVPGSNGVAWDRRGDLWVTDGGTAQGRVWRIGRDRVPVEMFRIQPLANDVIPTGIGRDVRGLPPGQITITPTGRQASNTLGSQHLVANGIAFTKRGDAVVADTARGAIWLIRLDHKGRVLSRIGCDTTFTANTLCLDNVLVQHPYLDGADGIVLDDDDNIYVAANERNAIAVVTDDGRAVELYRNPVGADRLRNAGPLEFPTSPVLVGRKLCVTNSDGNRRDNSPSTPGEGAKINCV